MAPPKAMQFGHALPHVLFQLANSDPTYSPVCMGKYDLVDGFYRIPLTPTSSAPLAVLLPRQKGQAQLVALPLTTTMGWTESPPVFLGATETIADLANARLIQYPSLPEHQLEQVAEIPADGYCSKDEIPVHASATHRDHTDKPVAYVDVFVDDLIGLAQGTCLRTLVSRAILHSIDNLFHPVELLDNLKHQEPASYKNNAKDNRHMATKKSILGWDIDTRWMTIRLTNHHLACLKELLDSIPQSRKCLPFKEWHKVLGELRSMMMALPGVHDDGIAW